MGIAKIHVVDPQKIGLSYFCFLPFISRRINNFSSSPIYAMSSTLKCDFPGNAFRINRYVTPVTSFYDLFLPKYALSKLIAGRARVERPDTALIQSQKAVLPVSELSLAGAVPAQSLKTLPACVPAQFQLDKFHNTGALKSNKTCDTPSGLKSMDSSRHEQVKFHIWFAIQVIPQHESKVDSILAYKGYEHFYPTYRPHPGSGRANATLNRPLFPGYVFCRTKPESSGLICTTPGVIRLVGCRGKPTPIQEEEIDAVRRVVKSNADAYPITRNLQIGQKVHVRTGILAGITGRLVCIKNRNRLLISIEITAQSIAVDVDINDIAFADPLS